MSHPYGWAKLSLHTDAILTLWARKYLPLRHFNHRYPKLKKIDHELSWTTNLRILGILNVFTLADFNTLQTAVPT